MKQRFSTRTRLVSALLTLAMVFTFLPFSAFAAEDPKGIRIDGDHFPNYEFRRYLKANIDKNGDGHLNDTELNIGDLDVTSQHIANLKGIEYFTNLTRLYCKDNKLTKLDLSGNAKLQQVYCSSNKLEQLNLSGNSQMRIVECNDNENLTTLDVSSNPYLKILRCSNNNLSELDLSHNPDLEILNCNKNKLSELDLSNNKNLKELYCANNLLKKLDVSNRPSLEKAICNDNQLVRLDMNNNGKMTALYASNNHLTSLNLTGTHITYKEIENNVCTVPANKCVRIIYLDDLPGGFDKTNVRSMNGGKIKGNTIEVDLYSNQVTYYYYCGNGDTIGFKILLDWVGEETDVAINENYFPDANFRDYVSKLDGRIDGRRDGALDVKESALTEVDISNLTIRDLEGIKYFTELEKLDCTKNKLWDLNLSRNIKLKQLHCENNILAQLNLENQVDLEFLDCSNNRLTCLNLPSMPNLKEFKADGNIYGITINKTDRTFDLERLSGKFLVEKSSEWNGGTVSGTTLIVDKDVAAVTYTYDCGNGRSMKVTLNITETDEPGTGGTGGTTPGGGTGTTTPPSGGEGTGTTTPPSGGGTGTTTPPSGGEGTGTTTPPSGGGTGTTTPPSGGGTGTTTPPSGGEGTGTTTPPSGGERTGTTTPPSGGEGTGTTTPPSGGGTGTTTPPSGGDGGGGAIVMVAGAAVAGVVGYGVYNYVSGQKLQALLPEGVAAPENRAQTALLLWNTAGRPEPAEAPAFADVADPDTAKAAQWCVEQGLMKRRLNGKFAPDSNIPAYQVLNAYRKLAG